MRLGFVIGFLIGAAIASVVSLAESDVDEEASAGGLLDQFRTQARTARLEANRAAAAKEAEMQRAWEESRQAKS